MWWRNRQVSGVGQAPILRAIYAAVNCFRQFLGEQYRRIVRVIFLIGKWVISIPVLATCADWLYRRLRRLMDPIPRHVQVWRTAWHEQRRQEPLYVAKGRELEFLPAVLEIQQTPASPAGRWVAATIITVFATSILWALLGHIDIIVVAQGKIIPSDRSKVVQPIETGVIKAIHVRDGDSVKQGDPLIEIDTNADADRGRLANEYLAAQTEVARLRALMAGKDSFEPPKGTDGMYIQVQRNRLREQIANLRALESRAAAYKKLYDKRYVSQMQYFEVERQRAEKAQEHGAALAEAETRSHSLSKEVVKAETRALHQHLSAPIDGVVQQLAVHTVGGVVTPAQQLMVIAPQEGRLEIEAWIENKDIGFLSENQEAEIKVESFPFTSYGIIEGRVLSLSRDAVPVEKVGLIYATRVSMNQSTMQVENGRHVQLSPGMAVTVEIRTGTRRLIEYFLSPLLRGVKEAARER